MKTFVKIIGIACYLALALLFLFVPSQAYADGGAPNLAYVAGGSKGIGIIDIAQQKLTGTVSLTGDPHTVYLSLDGRFLYVTQPALGRVVMISAQTKQTISTASVPGQPTLLAFDQGANVLYVAGNGADRVTALDPTSFAVKHIITTTSPVYGLAAADLGSGPSGSQIWVAGTASIMIFDSTGKQLASIPIPGGPQYLTIPTGTMVYVTTRSGEVDAIDLGTHQVLPGLLTGGTFGAMDYDAITGEIFVPDQKHNQVDVLAPVSSVSDAPPAGPSRVIHLDAAPESVAITSDGQFGFVALRDGNVVMLDIPGRQIVKMIAVGGSPQFIITGLYPPLVGTTPQQASVLSVLLNILAYTFVIILIVVPLLLLWRQRRKVG